MSPWGAWRCASRGAARPTTSGRTEEGASGPLDAKAQAKFGVAKGVLVAEVGSNTPAEKAGLSAGDVIVALDGTEVRELAKLRNAVAIKGAGKTATLEVRRDGKLKELKVTLGALPEQQTQRRIR